MPELPEVETIRAGAAQHVLGRPIAKASVFRERSVRRQTGGSNEFVALIEGCELLAAARRGKFLWFPMAALGGAGGQVAEEALVVHLGMSGQLRVGEVDSAHERIRLDFADGTRLSFVDQRTFGYMMVAVLVPTDDGAAGGWGSPLALVPAPVAHIGRDLLDEVYRSRAGRARLSERIRSSTRAIKSVLLDQSVISGIGNIYADEALWRARIHYGVPASALGPARVERLLLAGMEVLGEALAAGGTSFDALYVSVSGESGYFERSLNVYGREGEPCNRCGQAIKRESLTNRSSYFCPRCQRRR